MKNKRTTFFLCTWKAIIYLKNNKQEQKQSINKLEGLLLF